MSEYDFDYEDELLDVANVIDDDKEGSMTEYIVHEHSITKKEKEINHKDFINKATEEADASADKRKLVNSLKEKYMKKRQHFQRREDLSTVKHSKHENINKPDIEASSSIQLNLPLSMINEKITSTTDNNHNQQSTIIKRSHNELGQEIKSENINIFDYFDESQSDEEEEKLSQIQVETDVADYVHVSAYKMKNLFEDTSKFKYVV